MDQNGAGGGGALQDTALSFTGVVAITTFFCCSTMSCVALCIKLVTWMFGHRGRRRIPLLPYGQQRDHYDYKDEEGIYPHPPRPVIVLDTNPAGRQKGYATNTSDIELRQVPFGHVEEWRRVHDGGGERMAAAAAAAAEAELSKKRGGKEEMWHSGKGTRLAAVLSRDTTNGSTMTRTDTPSVNDEGWERLSLGSVAGDEESRDDDPKGRRGEQEEEKEERGEEGKDESQQVAEPGQLR